MSSQRIDHLDSLRGLASLSVVASHFSLMYGLPPSIQWLAKTPVHIVWDGALAVSLFFVLSGFVLSLSYIGTEQKKSRFSPVSYTIGRIFRIVPLAVAALLFSILLQKTIFRVLPTVPSFKEWALLFWKHPFSFSSILEFMPQVWSLGVELPTSLFVPVIAIISKKKKHLIYIFIGTYICILTLGLNKFVFDFLLGIFVARHRKWISSTLKRLGNSKKIGLLIGGIALYTSQYFLPVMFIHILNKAVVDMLGYGAMVILIVSLESTLLTRILSNKLFIGVGKLSYGIYLFHFSIFMGIAPHVLLSLNKHGILGDYSTRTILFLTMLILISLTSLLGKILIEDPFISIGKSLKNRLVILT